MNKSPRSSIASSPKPWGRIALIAVSLLLVSCSGSWKQLYEAHMLVSETTPEVTDGTEVSIHWIGTAGLYVSDGRNGFFIDPFVSRYGLLRVGLGLKLHPREDLVEEWLERVGTREATHVLVSHSHYDHSMDAPAFARKTGAALVGSQSSLHIAEGAGLPADQQVLAEPGVPFQAGDFTITFLESRHGPALFGRIPYPGEVEETLEPPVSARAYRLGATYSLLIEHPSGTFVHHGSAGIVPGMFDDITADVVLLGIAGRSGTEEYVEDVVDALEAERVVLLHFDNFFVPLDKPMRQLWSVKFKEFVTTTQAFRPALRLETLPLGERVVLLTGSPKQVSDADEPAHQENMAESAPVTAPTQASGE